MSVRLYNGVRLLGSGPCLDNIRKIDMSAMPMIQCMARTGLQVDLSHFAKMEVELVRDMDRITEEVHDITGYYINIDSGDQVSDLLFKKLGLKQARLRLTKSGDRESVDDETLTAIQHDHEVIPKILDYKELSKLKGTYVSPMPKLARRVGNDNWRMLPNFNTTRVPSGRLSCKAPNLLAMPTRTERGRDIRRGFITQPGWVYMSCDMSQIEVRMAAHYSLDPRLVSIYFNEEDIYSDFAITSFRLPDKRFKNAKGKWEYPGVDKMSHRYPAKTCILASIYEVSAKGLLEQMPVICAGCNLPATEHTCSRFIPLWTEDKCQSLINSFYIAYPGVMEDRMVAHAMARKHAFVWDLWGRILHVAAVRSVHNWVVSAALREASNFRYQSGAQGTIKLTMAETHDQWQSWKMQDVAHPLLQVHDELLYETRKDVAEDWGAQVKENFEHCAPLNVPVKANTATALTWGDLPK